MVQRHPLVPARLRRRFGRVGARPLRLERLEDRNQPSSSVLPALDAGMINPAALSNAFTGLTPALVRTAYGFDAINFNGAAADGRGQTIAVVTAYDHPTIENDLSMFNRRFGLPEVPTFTHVVPHGTPVDAGWAMETALDVQWAHAIAPGANLLLVSAKSNSVTDMLNAVNYARQQPGVSVVSMSWGTSEFAAQAWIDGVFSTPLGHDGVSFVAASGDFGAAAGAMWPASSPRVLAVGGTSVTIDAGGNVAGESAWSGSGGGYSRVFSGGGGRAIPDVAYSAAPETGFLVYNSVPDARGRTGWYRVGGTSAGAPQWAGLLAIANQGRALAGKTPLADARAAVTSVDSTAFNDIVSGSNGFAAGPGFDLATGRGTPIANSVVSQLIEQADTPKTEFVGPLPITPEASPSRTPTQQPPTLGIGGSQGTAAAALAQQDFNRAALTALISRGPVEDRPDSRLSEVASSDQRAAPPAAAPVIVAPTTSISAVDLSRRGGGGDEEQSEEQPNVVPPEGGNPPAATPANPGGATPATPAPPPAAPAGSGEVALAAPATLATVESPTERPAARGRNVVLLSVAGLASLAAGGFIRINAAKRRALAPPALRPGL